MDGVTNYKNSVLRHGVATADNDGSAVDFFDANDLNTDLILSYAASPTGTVTVVVEESDTGSGSWTTLYSFGQATVGLTVTTVKRTKRYLRCRVDVGASTQEHNLCCIARERLSRY